jgi:hypothetical protein
MRSNMNSRVRDLDALMAALTDLSQACLANSSKGKMLTPHVDRAFQALRSKFENRAAFDAFISSIDPPARRAQFITAAEMYLFLVKHGDWHVEVDGVDSVISYFTNSYKLIGLFAIIESLSDKKHLDFYAWLSRHATYPIGSKKELASYYDLYNADYGATRRCQRFFEKLPRTHQEQLCKAVEIDGKPLKSTKELAVFLYNLRSKFVHEAKFALPIGSPFPVLSNAGTKKRTTTKFKPGTIEDMFEEGLIAWFRD